MVRPSKVAARYIEEQIALRVAHRFATEQQLAMEHPSEEAKKKYLEDHPNADPANHKVKGGGGKIDHGPAEAEGTKGQARFDENKKQHSEMKALLKKVEDADPSAKKKFDRAYDKMFENGEKAANAAKKLLQKYENAPEGYDKGEDKEQVEAALSMMGRTLHRWESNKIDHHKAKTEMSAAKRMHQADNTYGYAQDLESFVKDFHKMLKDPHMAVDESWRNH